MEEAKDKATDEAKDEVGFTDFHPELSMVAVEAKDEIVVTNFTPCFKYVSFLSQISDLFLFLWKFCNLSWICLYFELSDDLFWNFDWFLYFESQSLDLSLFLWSNLKDLVFF